MLLQEFDNPLHLHPARTLNQNNISRLTKFLKPLGNSRDAVVMEHADAPVALPDTAGGVPGEFSHRMATSVDDRAIQRPFSRCNGVLRAPSSSMSAVIKFSFPGPSERPAS